MKGSRVWVGQERTAHAVAPAKQQRSMLESCLDQVATHAGLDCSDGVLQLLVGLTLSDVWERAPAPALARECCSTHVHERQQPLHHNLEALVPRLDRIAHQPPVSQACRQAFMHQGSRLHATHTMLRQSRCQNSIAYSHSTVSVTSQSRHPAGYSTGDMAGLSASVVLGWPYLVVRGTSLTHVWGQGGIILAGVAEVPVASHAEMAELLQRGSLQRATGATNMNASSSRSHAIFTILVEQRRMVAAEEPGDQQPSVALSSQAMARPFQAYSGANRCERRHVGRKFSQLEISL